MSMIHILDGTTDEILDVVTHKNIISDNHKKSLQDTLETYNFITFADMRYSEFLTKRNRLIIPDEDDTLREFFITETGRYRDSEGQKNDVYASATYLELKNSEPIEPQVFNGFQPSMMAGVAVNNTEWDVGIVESSATRTLTIGNHTNGYALLKRIATAFDLELRFRIEHDGNKVTGRYVDLLERRGEWRGRTIEYGKDLDAIKRTERTDNVVTALLGLGPEDEDGNRAEVTVEDNEALQRWGRPNKQTGQLMHIWDVYEPQSEQMDMTETQLRQYTRTELEKRINEVVTYETTVADLEHVPGMHNKKIRFGDTLRIKDTMFNPPLYIEARVFEQTRSIKNQAKRDIKLGDFTEFTEEEVSAIWKQLQQQIQSRITMYQLLEHTYDKITIDEKDEVILGDGQEYSRNVAKDAEDEAKSHADNVAQGAEDNAKGYTDQEVQNASDTLTRELVAQAIFDAAVADINNALADKASNSVVGDLEDLVAEKVDADWVSGQLVGKVDQEAYNTKISELVGDIADKVEQTDYDTKIQELVGDIGDKADIQYVDGQLVDKVNVGEVYIVSEIDSMFENVVSVTQYTTDMDGIVTDLTDHETRISQTETDIQSKVEMTVFTSLSDDVGNIGSELETAKTNISQNATSIESKAEQETVNTLSGEVSTLDSTVSQHAGLIESKVEQTEFNTVTGNLASDISTVEQTAQGIISDVSSIQGTIEDLEGDIGTIEGTLTSYNTRIEQNATDITARATIQSVNDLTGEVSDLEAEITAQAGLIEQRVTKTEYTQDMNGVINDLTDHESRITQTESDITSKVEVTTFQALENEVGGLEQEITSAQTSIQQNASAITQRATQASVNTLTGEVSDLSSEVSQNATAITSKVEQADFNSVTGTLGSRLSTVEQTASGIAINVSEVRADLDGLEIGGRNLLEDTSSDWTSVSHSRYYASLKGRLYLTDLDLTVGDTITLSMYVKTGSVAGARARIRYHDFDGTNHGSHLGTQIEKDTEGWIEVTSTIPNNTRDFFVAINAQDNGTSTGTFEYKYLKLEKGNKATDWTPAPEDVESMIGNVEAELSSHNTRIEANATEIGLRATSSEVNTLTGRVSTAESSITANATAITQRATQTSVNALTGRMDTAESTISQNASNITSRATKTEVNALTGRVSTAESTISQHASQIQSKVDDGDVRSIFTQEANSFTFDADQINFDGHVFGHDATFEGTIEGATIRGSTVQVNTGDLGSAGINDQGLYAFDLINDSGISITDGEIIASKISNPQDLDARVTISKSGLRVEAYNAHEGNPFLDVGYFKHFAIDGRTISSDVEITLDAALGVRINESDWDTTFTVEGYSVFDDSVLFRDSIYADLSGTTRLFYLDNGQNTALSTRNSGETMAIYTSRTSSGNMLEIRSHSGSWGSYRNAFYVTSNENVGVNSQFYPVGATENTTTNSANTYIFSGSKRMAMSTSSRKYKIAEKVVDVDPYNIFKVNPKDWYDKNEIEEYAEELTKKYDGEKHNLDDIDLTRIKRVPGIVAEDVAEAGLEKYVEFDKNGEVQSIMYDRLWTLLIPITRDHEDEITQLKVRCEMLEARVNQLEGKVS